MIATKLNGMPHRGPSPQGHHQPAEPKTRKTLRSLHLFGTPVTCVLVAFGRQLAHLGTDTRSTSWMSIGKTACAPGWSGTERVASSTVSKVSGFTISWRNSSVRMHRTHRSARVARRRGSGGQLSLVQSLLHLRAHSTPVGFVNVAVIDLFAQLSWR